MAAKETKIRLTRVYRGKPTKEQPIQPGIYVDGDDALLGVDASYLVEIGVAIAIEEPAEKSPSKSTSKDDDKEASSSKKSSSK